MRLFLPGKAPQVHQYVCLKVLGASSCLFQVQERWSRQMRCLQCPTNQADPISVWGDSSRNRMYHQLVELEQERMEVRECLEFLDQWE